MLKRCPFSETHGMGRGRMKGRMLGLAVSALVGATFPWAAAATEVIYSCEIQSGSDELLFREADQIAIDIDGQSVDLRVARTMGTSEPVNWKFRTQKTALDEDYFSVKQTPDGSWVGGGIYGAAGHAFELHNGSLTWTVVTLTENWTMRWVCKA